MGIQQIVRKRQTSSPVLFQCLYSSIGNIVEIRKEQQTSLIYYPRHSKYQGCSTYIVTFQHQY